MSGRDFVWVFSAAVLGLYGCGAVGPTQYPALKISTPVNDLRAVERGNQIDVYFTIPALTTEGLAIVKTGPIDLRAGPNATNPFDVNGWADAATKVPVPLSGKPGPVHVRIPIGGWTGQDVIVAARVANGKGRESAWSNLATVMVKPPLAAPANLKAEPGRPGVQLSWSASDETSFRIFRQAEGQPEPAQIATSDTSSYLDTMAEFKKTYRYYVQGLNASSESEVAGPVAVTPEDIYPPAVPAGLTATTGINAIELAWERNIETDLAGYRVYRAELGGPFQLLVDMVPTPDYSDHGVQSGKRYRYAVSSVARNGHESGKSMPVEATAP